MGTQVKAQKANRPSAFTAFIEWSVLTTSEKKKADLPTAKSFASKHKVHESQLSRWKSRSDFKSEKAMQQRLKWSDQTPDVIEGLYKRCTKYGTAHDVELWLVFIEGWDRKLSPPTRPALEFEPHDIRVLVSRLPKEKQRMYYSTLAELVAEDAQIRANGFENQP